MCSVFLRIILFAQCYYSYQVERRTSDEIFHVATPTNCNHVFFNQSFGILTSPFFPLGYPDGTSCKWEIKMEEGSRIVLSIKAFTLGPGDRLEITENSEASIYSLESPPNDVIFSSGNVLSIQLTSNKTKSQVVDHTIKELNENHTFYAVFEKEGCGGLLTESSGYITVPSYIHLSQKSHQCAWTILGPANKVIDLQFLQFDLPPGSCPYTNIYLREGERTAGYVLGDFCEENPPVNELRSSSNVVYIAYRTRPNFLSSRVDMLPTVKMFYKFSEVCGGELTGYSGSFATPRRWLDDVYSCNWTINVPQQKYVSLNFKEWSAAPFIEDEVRIVVPSKNEIYWSSNTSHPSKTLVIPSNKVVISLTSYRKKSSLSTLNFYGVFQAVASMDKQCIDVGYKQLFMCDEWKYIDCSLKCDGVNDCDNAIDENNCPLQSLETAIVLTHHHAKPHNVSRYSVALFTIVGILMFIFVVWIMIDRFYKKGERASRPRMRMTNKYPRSEQPYVRPPPYVEYDESQPEKINTPPPPYSLCEEASYCDNESLRRDITASDARNRYNNTNNTSVEDQPMDESTELFHDTDILGSSGDVATLDSVNIPDIIDGSADNDDNSVSIHDIIDGSAEKDDDLQKKLYPDVNNENNSDTSESTDTSYDSDNEFSSDDSMSSPDQEAYAKRYED